MPLHTKKQIKNGIVALWHITESKDELLKLLPPSWKAVLNLDKVSNHNLAARVLASHVCPDFSPIEKDEYGKPYFESTDHKISITHASEFAGFMLTKDRDCGIDMEEITDRIRRISHKFIREDEKDFIEEDLNGMYAVWCAKEAMYKYYGLKSLDFKNHMRVEYSKLNDSGKLIGYIEKDDYHRKIEMEYEFFNNYLNIHTA